MKIVLFDIDGTLLTCGGAGKRAVELAFLQVVGREDILDFSLGGMTDRGIMRAGLRNAGWKENENTVDRLIEVYLENLPELIRDSPNYRVFEPAAELAYLLAAQSFTVGLGTGNVEAGARIKLARAGLNSLFEFGGFGCDHEIRDEVLRAGATRGRSRAGDLDVVVVGDTPRDIYSARAIGATCVAVATGGHSVQELSSHEPQLCVPSLDDPRVLDFFLE